MDFIKKNLYWVILGVVVLIALVAYPMFVSDVETDAAKKLTDCNTKLTSIHKAAATAGKDDMPRTQAHVKKAEQYKERVDTQIVELLAGMKEWKINQTFKEPPPPAVLDFDNWLTDRRTELYKQLNDAGILFPRDTFDKLTFADSHTANEATSTDMQRPYRIKRMAIVTELVGALSKKYGKQDTTRFQNNDALPEQKEQADAGVIKIDTLTVTDPDKAMKAELDNYAKAYRSAGRGVESNAPKARAVDLPYMFTTVETEFYAPLVSVPAIVKALESSEKYHAVVTKLDMTRGATPFPKPEDALKPGPDDRMLNTYYREGPVKVIVGMNIYEYDSSKLSGVTNELAVGPAAAETKK